MSREGLPEIKTAAPDSLFGLEIATSRNFQIFLGDFFQGQVVILR
jgi:hypothetical protein